MDCINCGKELIQLKNKRSKVFCNSTCRSNHWQKTKKLEDKGMSTEYIIKEVNKTAKKRKNEIKEQKIGTLPESPKKSELSDFWKQRMAKKLGIK